MHEQRGIGQRVAPGGPLACRIEYTEPSASRPNGKPHPTWGVDGLVSLSGESVPPEDYPCQLISCNAQCNHRIMEGIGTKRLVGPARLVVASRDAPGLAWRFQVPEVEPEQAQHQLVAASIDGGGAGESKQGSDCCSK